MSRRAIGWVILGGLLAAPAAAQNLPVLRDRLLREAQLATQASEALLAHRSLERRFATATDTIVIAGGSITVLADRNIADVARDAARQADSILRQIAGALPRIRGDKVYIVRDTSSMYIQAYGHPMAVIRYSAAPHRNASHNVAEVDAEEIARQIEVTAINRAANLGGTPFVKWRRGNLPLRDDDLAREPDWGTTRFDILEWPSLLGPRCYRGDIVACSMQLGLTPVDDPVMTWYDSLTRVSTVRQDTARARRFNAADTDECLRGSDAACGRVLHTLNMFELPPAGPAARDALTWQAIKMGGEGAIERLITHPGTPAEAIAAAARVPADSVVRAWHRNIREGSLGSDDVDVSMVLVAIGWIALLGFLATRITRWR